ncbi:hypothetical protein M9H77_30446 [Catharanthus roseus]|uniref:Uncharacterized protein n=1 Tax=Catharanthus roseus TaxID=4058 RepID=A0ACB9ZXL6_CATRO|nr:hypothetical protein M9H77_30446 [Catharanthus roseus]
MGMEAQEDLIKVSLHVGLRNIVFQAGSTEEAKAPVLLTCRRGASIFFEESFRMVHSSAESAQSFNFVSRFLLRPSSVLGSLSQSEKPRFLKQSPVNIAISLSDEIGSSTVSKTIRI